MGYSYLLRVLHMNRITVRIPFTVVMTIDGKLNLTPDMLIVERLSLVHSFSLHVPSGPRGGLGWYWDGTEERRQGSETPFVDF